MKNQKEKRPFPLMRILVFVIAAAVFLYAGFQMFAYWKENYASKKVTEQLAQAVTVITPKETTPDSELTEPSGESVEESSGLSATIPIRVDFESLQADYPDIIAWIYCPNTAINYPIVQGEDNQYYVSHMPDGSYNSSGSIFMDFRNAPDLSDRNSLIYGHNMTNDTMFAQLLEYKDQAYYDAHPELWILTKECAYRVDLIAGAVVASDSDAYKLLDTDEALSSHLKSYTGRSTFTADYDLSSVERIVTLSTCSYEYRTARYVVMGNLVPIPYAE